MNSVSNIENEYKSEITKLEKESEITKLEKWSEKCKIIGGCLIALAIIIVVIAIALFFIVPLFGAVIGIVVGVIVAFGLLLPGSILICGAQYADKEINECKQKIQELLTLSMEKVIFKTRVQKAELDGVDLSRVV